MVELFAIGNDDGVLVRALVAPFGLITDVQFAEMRYAGKPRCVPPRFRAVYLGC